MKSRRKEGGVVKSDGEVNEEKEEHGRARGNKN